ncbi:uncharacterized protein LY89DRAFT_669958 [Mollisia scopiformis]|uniref:Uncharacterized protein n=1 Tax=Mollisia scopiformis TaxID=149040 RepID=A0A194X8K7_MOLSC|nr:uncharacterized protein LY89DRAFT_669958 [Mollisia scopiformis]KUJ16444.1 hypothetical protein LY89DRAFT_669958 [Mollisia scopiformis]
MISYDIEPQPHAILPTQSVPRNLLTANTFFKEITSTFLCPTTTSEQYLFWNYYHRLDTMDSHQNTSTRGAKHKTAIDEEIVTPPSNKSNTTGQASGQGSSVNAAITGTTRSDSRRKVGKRSGVEDSNQATKKARTIKGVRREVDRDSEELDLPIAGVTGTNSSLHYTNYSYMFPGQPRPQAQRNPSFQITIPSGDHKELDGRHPPIIFPNANCGAAIRSPSAIWEAARTVLTQQARQLGGSDAAEASKQKLWDNIAVYRDNVWLGNLNDIRLAFQFSLNESFYKTQLDFKRIRTRKLSSKSQEAGFYLVNSSGLYLKVSDNKVAELNKDLLIDLGKDLNDELATLTMDGHKTVMVDLRTMNTDGLPIPDGCPIVKDVLAKGPQAFPTEFTRTLAGCCGWTNGHAHMGIAALCSVKKGDPKPELGVFEYLY